MSQPQSRQLIDATLKMFQSLTQILEEAKTYAEANKLQDETLANWRISADMLPLRTQIQIATEIPARGLSRLARQEVPSFDDPENTLDAFIARIQEARAVVEAISTDAIDADPKGELVVPTGGVDRTFVREDFGPQFILPNLYFHVTAAYLIFRQIGVPLGKRHYLAYLQ